MSKKEFESFRKFNTLSLDLNESGLQSNQLFHMMTESRPRGQEFNYILETEQSDSKRHHSPTLFSSENRFFQELTEHPDNPAAKSGFSKRPEALTSELENLLHIRIKSEIEKLDEKTDKLPFLELRMSLLRIKYAISELFKLIVESDVFQVVIFLVILGSTIELGFEDPTWVEVPPPYDFFEFFFACLYTVEFGMKVLAYGMYVNSDSYFRSWWNILDFTIIVTAWLNIYAGSGVKLSALRSLRILRPLRSIRTIKGMKALFLALINAILPLLSALFILFFFILIFAIIALELWMNEFKGRCYVIETGIISNLSYICGSSTCSVGEECIDQLDNPNNGVSHYDNILMSLVTVFQIITLEGWTTNLITAQTAYSYWSVLYFMPLIFITGNLIQDFVQAIIAIAFKQVAEKMLNRNDNSENITNLNDKIFEEIYKNTFMRDENKWLSQEGGYSSEFFDSFSVKGDDQYNIEIQRVDDFKENASYMEDLQGEVTNLIPRRISSDFLIDKNSLFSKDSSIKKKYFKKKSTGTGSMSRISRDPLVREFGHSRMETNNIATIDQGDPELSKYKLDYYRLKSAITIKNKTLNFLIKNPSFIKSSRVEVISTFPQESNSRKSVKPNIQKPLSNPHTSSYRSPASEDSLLLFYKKLSIKKSKKYPEFDRKFQLFKNHSLKNSKKTAFFNLSINSKIFIDEKTRIFSSDLLDWSGLDISLDRKDYHNFLALKCSGYSYMYWSPGIYGKLQKIKYPLMFVMTHKLMNYLTLIAVAINTIVLSLERYNISQNEENILQSMNNFFTYFFTAEIFLKLIAIGPVKLLRDFMNIFDASVVTISLIEVFILSSGSSAVSSFRAIRILRIFRVLRVVRLFRYLKSIAEIVNAISKSLSNIGYLFMLLALFQLLFTLTGMQVFGGTFNFTGQVPRGNFDSFHWAFVSTYQVLSIENWNDILTSSLRSQAGPGSCLFLIAWIILGNFILLNLFLAILLDSFSRSEEEPIEPSSKKSLSKLKQKLEELEKYVESDSENIDIKILRLKTTELSYLECEKSYFVFTKEHPVRKFCHRLVVHKYFDYFMLFLIFLNSVKLASDTYILDSSSDSINVKASDWLDNAFTILFDIEFFIKSIAFGFAFSRNTYLTDNWNKLDFAIVILCNIDLALTDVNIPIIKVFRMLRTLRPLKLIKHNVSLKIVVTALLESIVAILNVWILILLIFLIFGILGVSLLSGKMHRCSFPNILDEVNCVSSGHEWVEGRFNFDNVLQAGIVLFVVMSQESWPNRMLEGVDARGVGQAPQVNSNPGMSYFYIVFLFISNFFLLNIFTCVVFNKFTEAKKNESSLSSLLMSKKQMLWTEIQPLIIKAKPWNRNIVVSSSLRRFFHSISKDKKFEVAIFGFILINLASMAMPFPTASSEYNSTLDYINVVCTFVFIAEAGIKIIGLAAHYFKSNWNRFDFLIAAFSLVDIILTYTSNRYFPLLRQVPQIIRIIRIVRVLRLFRLIKSLKTLEKLLTIMTYALPAILNVLGLLMLIFFIYAVLGCYLFHDVQPNLGITNWYNFSNFHNSMNILWRISTGEDYPNIMLDTVVAQQNYGNALYFISFVTVVNFVVLDLFITITLQYFEEFYVNPYNPMSLFTEDLKIFKSRWQEESQEFVYKINKESVIKLIGKLGLDFKFLKTDDKLSVVKLIGAMNIECDNEDMFYFNDVLYAILRRKYEKKVNKRKNKNDFTIMRMQELKTRNELRKLRNKYINRILKNTGLKEDGGRNVFGDNGNTFFDVFFMKTVFNSWKKFRANAVNLNNQVTPGDSVVEHPGDVSIVSE